MCRKAGHLNREYPNKTHIIKLNVRSSSTDGHHNSAEKEKLSRQAVLRCYTFDGICHKSKNVTVRHYFVEIGTNQEMHLREQYYNSELSMVFWWMTLCWIMDVPKL